MSIVVLWDLDLGNIKATPYIELRVASPLLPPPLKDANHYPPLPGTSFPGLYSIGSSHVQNLRQLRSTNDPTLMSLASTTHTTLRPSIY
ncbi:uncharacterized protein C8R40DRAFT_1177664 [Lentinula edodes]|uniref:uncharacterized protein n=1 Tax=Lentinula edodes TaxID=5353 RepID=UPI001E8D7AE2|nr:uncharacterized protein C8R40DRAFT_1177664 [Lentinula edodes]KAH7868585.1 hypothetical protein C8R40DRAFT_1177664 [Lentinula edodes]